MARITYEFPHRMRQKDVGRLFGVSARQVQNWDLRKNDDGTVDLCRVVEQRLAHAAEEAVKSLPAMDGAPASEGEASARERKLNAEADLAEIKVARELEQLVLRENVDVFIAHSANQFISAIQAAIKTLPLKVEGLEVREIHKIVERELTAAIEQARTKYEPED